MKRPKFSLVKEAKKLSRERVKPGVTRVRADKRRKRVKHAKFNDDFWPTGPLVRIS